MFEQHSFSRWSPRAEVLKVGVQKCSNVFKCTQTNQFRNRNEHTLLTDFKGKMWLFDELAIYDTVCILFPGFCTSSQIVTSEHFWTWLGSPKVSLLALLDPSFWPSISPSFWSSFRPSFGPSFGPLFDLFFDPLKCHFMDCQNLRFVSPDSTSRSATAFD